MTKNVERLTKRPRMADTAIATTEAAVYSYLQVQKIDQFGYERFLTPVCISRPTMQSHKLCIRPKQSRIQEFCAHMAP